MNIDYFMKIQNAYGTNSKRERELAKTNREMSRHFEDTYDTRTVLVNGKPMELMIVHDTENNTYRRKIKSRHEDVFNLGDYVDWDGKIWIITLIDSDTDTWNRGAMCLCDILLRWQNANGEIIERYAYSEDFTKYSTGVDGNKVLMVGDYQYGLTLPVDDETKVIKRDRRFPIDIEGVEPPDVYKLTNRKVLLNDNSYFGRGGVLTWTLSFDSFNPEADKKIMLPDGKEVWICDYIPIEPITPLPPPYVPKPKVAPHIIFDKTIKIGFPRECIIELTDKDGNIVPVDGHTISLIADCEFSDEISITPLSPTTYELLINNDNLIDEKFKLVLSVDEKYSCEMVVTIVDIWS